MNEKQAAQEIAGGTCHMQMVCKFQLCYPRTNARIGELAGLPSSMKEPGQR
jgi:hypothetical protein